ncbi:unnamed protein product [Notodromas monacha]|uniref:Acyl-CoA dehydrogenase family member 11 n=1 Tax=Notodromas monacha TaxID=399045 RepID=A0A7R9BWD0_9CRUS|nr:unnamed protein product [Notodromas monacha]CAG0921805.1 unnamed protein product [Notodromas monacha]
MGVLPSHRPLAFGLTQLGRATSWLSFCRFILHSPDGGKRAVQLCSLEPLHFSGFVTPLQERFSCMFSSHSSHRPLAFGLTQLGRATSWLSFCRFILHSPDGGKRAVQLCSLEPLRFSGFVTPLRERFSCMVFEDVDADLLRFGERTGKELWALSRECERNQPSLVQFDAWGQRDDQVITCNAWKELKAIGAEEGIVGLAYQRKHGQWSRLHQIAKMFLFHPSSAFVTCPFAMTDGAAKTIEALQLRGVPEIKEAFSRLTSMDRSNFWTSGQWMTERGGGSDVANGTETIAIQQPGDGTRFKLYGYKWFSSAIDADVTFTLARIRDGDGNTSAGTKGLSMFFAKLRDEEGRLNNMEVMKLKNKLGTKQLPTAELLLDGLDAILVSEPGHGVASISQMLTVTRLHSAIGAISAARRLMQLCRDYSCRRSAFGMMIKDSPLHMLNLSSLEIQIRAGELFLLDVSRYLGADDVGLLQKDESILFRLLTPVLKAFYAKTMVNVCCELMEAFGGQGYIEDTGIPCLVRDAQVHSIWEGTTNVLSLDVLRVLAKTKGEVLLIFNERIKRMTLDVKNAVEKRGLSDCSEALVTATTSLLKTAASTSLDQMCFVVGASYFNGSYYIRSSERKTLV